VPYLKNPNERARILLVDDDERNLFAIKTVIEEIADIVVATSGEEALRQLLQHDFAVILLDVFMPGMDGYETAQLIRQRRQSRRTPIIFLSAVNKEDDHLLRGYAMGAVDYVFKPVQPVVLRSKVAVFVDLYEKTSEIQRKALEEQRLLGENLRAREEKLAAEQALRRAEQRQAAAIHSLPIALYIEAPDMETRRPLFLGGDLPALTGFTADMVGEPGFWAQRIHAEDAARLASAHEVDRGRNLAVEYRWRSADGSYRHFLDQAVILRDEDGTPKEIVGTLLDVTERRLLEGQLVQAQKMDAIGKLTGGIAHDFNNLLAAVLGGIGIIERRYPLDDKGREILGMTRHAAEQGSELVRRLLAFARKQQLDPAPVAVDRMAKSMKGLMAHTLGGLVQLEWEQDPAVWPALADESQLELALMNLVINARDALPEGGMIRVTARNEVIATSHVTGLPHGDYVVLAVKDDGTGIDPEVLEHIFEPFFTTKEVGKGTGLGLSMVYGFAQQSGGTAHVESVPGEGTCVELWLPRATVPVVDRTAGTPSVPPRDALKGLRILLVDDNPVVRATTAALLDELGHIVTDAASASDGMSLLNASDEAFDLLVTDYAMPQTSGTEMIRQARALASRLPAILITGYADGDMIANRPSDVVVLNKPFARDQLIGAIAGVVGRQTRDA
jgi:PAS domain S-box-containing protein